MDEKNKRLRAEKVLEIVVQTYILTARPISSRYVSRKLGLSSATIRNVMSDLEEMGLISHPHISAGSRPTDKGYRFYVDSLMHLKKATEKQIKQIELEYHSNVKSLENILEKTTHMLSKLTNCAGAALLFYNMALEDVRDHLVKKLQAERNSLYKLVNAAYEITKAALMGDLKEKLYFDGASHILGYPEFKDQRKWSNILRFLEEKKVISGILSEDLYEDKLRIRIGSENKIFGLDEFSVITAGFKIKDKIAGRLGIIGPTRMDYEKIIPIVEFMGTEVTKALSY